MISVIAIVLFNTKYGCMAVEGYTGVLSLLLKPTKNVIDYRMPLNSGTSIPIIGLGTYLVKPKQIFTMLDAALSYGYRHIDTAPMYGNEEAIGFALNELLPKHDLKREDIFITTKLSPEDMGKDNVQDAVSKSMFNLGISYIDLYLIHWPGKEKELPDKENARLRLESWKEMIKLHNNGKGYLRAIGVSNFMINHLTHIINETGVPPAINQIEFHPYLNYKETFYDFCVNHSIVLEAYGSLGGTDNNLLLKDEVMNDIAKHHNVTPAQVLLRWGLQQGYVIIPKATTRPKLKLNTQLDFKLENEELLNITRLDRQKKFSWDPETVA